MITTRADCLSFLGKTASLTDAEEMLLELLRPQAEQAVKDLLGYSVEQATHTLYLPRVDRTGNELAGMQSIDVQGSQVTWSSAGGVYEDRFLYSPEVPIRSVTSIYEDTSAYAGQGSSDFGSTTLLTAGTDYFVPYESTAASPVCRSGKIVRIGGYWPSRPGTVKATLVAGYTAAELANGIAAGIKLACLYAIQDAFAKGGEDDGGDIQSIRLGDFSATYGAPSRDSLPPRAKRLLRPFMRMGRMLA